MDKGQQMRNAGLSIFELSSEWDFVGGGGYINMWLHTNLSTDMVTNVW